MKRWWLEEGAREWVDARRPAAKALKEQLQEQDIAVITCSPEWYSKGWEVTVDRSADLEKVPSHYQGDPIKKTLYRSTERQLLRNLREAMPQLEELLKKANSHWSYQDPIYRFYHHSFKVYYLQGFTQEIADLLLGAAPEGAKINKQYLTILKHGTGRRFNLWHNRWWDFNTRPIIEAFFHTKFFLEMAVIYAKERDPDERLGTMLDSGYAALLYLYNMR